MDRANTNTRLTPKMVLTIYSDKNDTQFYIEQRPIASRRGKYEMGVAVPLAHDVMRDLAKSYVKQNNTAIALNGYVPNHLIYGLNRLGMSAVIWYRPAMRRALNFSLSLKIKDAHSVQLPATLYAVVNNALYVFSLASDSRPDLKTKLYHAPFFNVYADGQVCKGSANMGKRTPTFAGEAERFEVGFYRAEQNGNGNGALCKTPLKKLWPELIKSGAAFPKSELVPHKYKTLNDLITKVINKDGNNDDYEEEENQETDPLEVLINV